MYTDYGRNVRSPWQLDFVWWCLIFGGPQHGICFTSPFWHLEFGKICAPLAQNIYVNFNLNYCSSQTIFINGATSLLSYSEHTYIFISPLKALDKNLPQIITREQTNGSIKANVLNKLLPTVYKRTASKWKLLNISSPKEDAHNGRKWISTEVSQQHSTLL